MAPEMESSTTLESDHLLFITMKPIAAARNSKSTIQCDIVMLGFSASDSS
jgi:hypothetical protein